jgi:hypothetical protein
MKKKTIKPIMTLQEFDAYYQASVNGEVVTVQKDVIIVKDGIRQHPRLVAIEQVAELAKIKDWILFNC